jgi:hypothetical protein
VALVEQVHVEERIAAQAAALYEMVSDITRMGSWSPETTACRWIGGATAPAVGARFKGANKRGWRHWQTACTVVAAEPGRRFAFDVTLGPLPIARWAYDFVPDGDGCRVVETWTDRRPALLRRLSPFVMGVADQAAHNREGMRATLAQLRVAATS